MPGRDERRARIGLGVLLLPCLQLFAATAAGGPAGRLVPAASGGSDAEWALAVARRLAEEKLSDDSCRQIFSEFTDAERSLTELLSLLPHSALESWRVRDFVGRLSWQARPGSGNGAQARREIRVLAAYLTGRCPRMPGAALLAHHLLLAYRRVRELLAIRRCASRCRGTKEERVALVEAKTHCAEDDARWAVRQEAQRRTHRLDEAVPRARAEGFEIPHGSSEAEAFLRMRDLLVRRGLLRENGASVDWQVRKKSKSR
ncbi:MAG: hypothetical protein ACRD3M_19110 [Thermoanaerobaculia bacterium]